MSQAYKIKVYQDFVSGRPNPRSTKVLWLPHLAERYPVRRSADTTWQPTFDHSLNKQPYSARLIKAGYQLPQSWSFRIDQNELLLIHNYENSPTLGTRPRLTPCHRRCFVRPRLPGDPRPTYSRSHGRLYFPTSTNLLVILLPCLYFASNIYHHP